LSPSRAGLFGGMHVFLREPYVSETEVRPGSSAFNGFVIADVIMFVVISSGGGGFVFEFVGPSAQVDLEPL
jgi:hypothetical protein